MRETSRLPNHSRRNDRGVSFVEYALLLALIALVSVAGVHALGIGIANNFDNVRRQGFAGGGGVVCAPGTPGYPNNC